MELNANGSLIFSDMIRFALPKPIALVDKIVLHPIQKISLEKSLLMFTEIVKNNSLPKTSFAGIPMEVNALVPEDTIWLVDKEGNVVSTIRNLAIPKGLE